MSSDIMTNQISKDVLSSQAVTKPVVSQSQNRQNVAAQEGKTLPPETEKQEISSEELQEAVAKLNEHVQQIQRDLQFSVDDSSGHTVVRVVDSETDEVVRQLPSEEALRISRNIKEQLEDGAGLIFNASA